MHWFWTGLGWAVLSLLLDHARGVYEPSQVTGHGAGHYLVLGGLLLVLAATVVESLRRRSAGRGLAAGVAVVLGLTIGTAIVTILYLEVVWKNFPSAMADYSERTLRASGKDEESIRLFVAGIRAYWRHSLIVGRRTAMAAGLPMALLAVLGLFAGMVRWLEGSR